MFFLEATNLSQKSLLVPISDSSLFVIFRVGRLRGGQQDVQAEQRHHRAGPVQGAASVGRTETWGGTSWRWKGDLHDGGLGLASVRLRTASQEHSEPRLSAAHWCQGPE